MTGFLEAYQFSGNVQLVPHGRSLDPNELIGCVIGNIVPVCKTAKFILQHKSGLIVRT